MQRTIKVVLLLFGIVAQSVAQERSSVVIKPSYFFFSHAPIKDIYDCGHFQVQGSLSVPLHTYLQFYSSAGYRSSHGHSLSSHEKTSINSVSVDVGIQPTLNFGEHYNLFCTIGPRYFSLHQHNQSVRVDGIVHGAGLGFFMNAGAQIFVGEHIVCGFFGEYSYEKKKICPLMRNVYSNGAVHAGGFAFGVTAGYAF